MLYRVAVLVVADHIGERFNLAVKKLSKPDLQDLAQDMATEQKSLFGRQILAAARGQFESRPELNV